MGRPKRSASATCWSRRRSSRRSSCSSRSSSRSAPAAGSAACSSSTGFATEEQICEALARQLNIPYVNLKFFNLNNELVRRLPEAQARRFRAHRARGPARRRYLVGMADPTDLFAFDELARAAEARHRDRGGQRGRSCCRPSTASTAAPRRSAASPRSSSRTSATRTSTSARSARRAGAEDAPVVKLLQSVFEDAVQVERLRRAHRAAGERSCRSAFASTACCMPQTEADTKIAPGAGAAPEADGGPRHLREAPAAGRPLRRAGARRSRSTCACPPCRCSTASRW